MSLNTEFSFCPKLRPGLAAAADGDPRFIYLWDKLCVSTPLRLTRPELLWAQLLNGCRSLREIQGEAMRRTGGLLIPLEQIEHFIERLDESLFLDNERFSAFLAEPDREPSCIGSY